MKNTKSSDVVVTSSAKVSELASMYCICVSKTATSILELANVVYRAKNLTKPEYELFRRLIQADKSKDSYLKKLHRIAQKSSRLMSIKEKLPATYTTLYELTKLTDAQFEQVCEADAISPSLTIKELSKFKAKKSKPITQTTTSVNFSIKSSSTIALHKVLIELEKLCIDFDVELNSTFDFSTLQNTNHLKRIDEIQDVTFTPIALVA